VGVGIGIAAQALGAAMNELDADDQLSAGVTTGADGTFCAGMNPGLLGGGRPLEPWQGFAGIAERSRRNP
jgi:enoyl-CoA hydratase